MSAAWDQWHSRDVTTTRRLLHLRDRLARTGAQADELERLDARIDGPDQADAWRERRPAAVDAELRRQDAAMVRAIEVARAEGTADEATIAEVWNGWLRTTGRAA